MKQLALAVVLASLAGSAAAAEKTYQVTGPVVDVRPDAIVVQKGKENWEIARGAATKSSAEPKKGDKVTVQYTMTATSIDVKSGDTKKAKK